MDLTEKILDEKRVFEGRALTIDVRSIELPDGRRTTREIVRHRGAVVVLGQRPDGKFILIRQHRCAVGETLLEMVAGGVEIGEEIELAARREMEEESGYKVTDLHKIGVSLPCPGYSEERQYFYFAELEQQPQAQQPDFDENLMPVVMSATEIDTALDNGTLIDGKSVALWLMWRRRSSLSQESKE